ncbi:MAG: hypothetical protein QM688_10960 [Sphingomonas bacterium]
MSVDQHGPSHAPPSAAAPILARAAQADARARRRLDASIEDFFLCPRGRLDDRTRAAVHAAIVALLEDCARALVGDAADTSAIARRLADAGLLRDREFMDEVIGQARLALLGAALDANREPGVAATLLPRLAVERDKVIAAAARDYMLLEGKPALPTVLHRRITWWVAAALREGHAGDGALAEAALRCMEAHDDNARIESAALRLAAAIDARAEELPELLIAALSDGCAELAVAVIAYARRIDFADARALLLDPDGDRLWLVLRAHGFAREALARVALLLADADPHRDIEAFADQLDTIAAIPVLAAREALAPLALHADFRGAIDALARRRSE